MERIFVFQSSLNGCTSEAGSSSPKEFIQNSSNWDSSTHDTTSFPVTASGTALLPYGLPQWYKKLFPAKKSLVFLLVTTFPSKNRPVVSAYSATNSTSWEIMKIVIPWDCSFFKILQALLYIPHPFLGRFIHKKDLRAKKSTLQAAAAPRRLNHRDGGCNPSKWVRLTIPSMAFSFFMEMGYSLEGFSFSADHAIKVF